VLITVSGFSGHFERMIGRIPISIASGMLAGVLLRFGLDAFVAMQSSLRWSSRCSVPICSAAGCSPRYAIVVTLLLGVGIAARAGAVARRRAAPRTGDAGIHHPGIVVAGADRRRAAALRGDHGLAERAGRGRHPRFRLPGTDFAADRLDRRGQLLLAPFGGFALNLAAITAAICMSREAHQDPRNATSPPSPPVLLSADRALRGHRRRAFPGLPEGTGLAIAGFALLGTIGSALATALGQEAEREPALLTFLVTASGLPWPESARLSGACWPVLRRCSSCRQGLRNCAGRLVAAPPVQQDRHQRQLTTSTAKTQSR
jgi:benzoate membrane transport protein